MKYDVTVPSPGDLDSPVDVPWRVSTDLMQNPAWYYRKLVCRADNNGFTPAGSPGVRLRAATDRIDPVVTASSAGDLNRSADVS